MKKIKKQLLSMLMILSIVLSLMSSNAVFAEEEKKPFPTSIVSPEEFNATIVNKEEIAIRWKLPKSIKEIINADTSYYDKEDLYTYDVVCVLDWKTNDGPWLFGDNKFEDPYNDGWRDDLFYFAEMDLADVNDVNETSVIAARTVDMEKNFNFDFTNNTYHFRMRYLLRYDEEGLNEYKYIASPWTPISSVGKGTVKAEISKLDAPYNLKAEVKKNSKGKPYFALSWTIPDNVTEANKSITVEQRIDFKVGNGNWHSDIYGIDQTSKGDDNVLLSSSDFDAIEKDFLNEIVVEKNTYHFRVLFETQPINGKIVRSAFSNVISIGVEKYSDASPWAVLELDKAAEYGLITDSIKNKMSQPITREEFAELAVRLYEVYTGKKSEPISPNPFKDCTNPEILKAFKLGIVNGISTDKFDPKALTNREQIAAMLNRAAKVLKPEADFSTAGAPKFADEKDISAWFLENVRYMSKAQFLKGSDNKFSPKNNATCQEAVLIAVRLYEAFK